MTRDEMTEKMDRIADAHGCVLVPAAGGMVALAVLDQYRQGDPLDDRRISACLAELRATGCNVSTLVQAQSRAAVPAIESAPAITGVAMSFRRGVRS